MEESGGGKESWELGPLSSLGGPSQGHRGVWFAGRSTDRQEPSTFSRSLSPAGLKEGEEPEVHPAGESGCGVLGAEKPWTMAKGSEGQREIKGKRPRGTLEGLFLAPPAALPSHSLPWWGANSGGKEHELSSGLAQASTCLWPWLEASCLTCPCLSFPICIGGPQNSTERQRAFCESTLVKTRVTTMTLVKRAGIRDDICNVGKDEKGQPRFLASQNR